MSESDRGEKRRLTTTEMKLLRLQCPFCGAEYPLWFAPDEPSDGKDMRAEWEEWLDQACAHCGKTPREHVEKPD